MWRRDFITLLGGAAATWPLPARAQQAPVIGALSSNAATSGYVTGSILPAFRQGLKEVGFVESQNAVVEFRWAEGHYDRLPGLAADLISHQVSLLVAFDNAAALAVKSANPTMPFVFAIGGDPINLGLVASMKNPGANVTGATFLSTTSQAIQLQMLHEAVPDVALLGALMNPTNPNAAPNIREMEDGARALGLKLQIQNAVNAGEIDTAFAAFMQGRVGAIVIGGDPLFSLRINQIAGLTLRHGLPAIYPTRDFVSAGGLMTYGASNAEAYRAGGIYAGRILKGEKPSDLPVQQATKVELILNLATAKILGLAFPLTLLGRADEVIE
jgi:putative tryptophan/tyrosine transport system substrate-binding protein